MKRLLVLALVAACSHGPSVGVAADCGAASTKPQRIVVACGDGSVVLDRLSYDSWTATRATGRGTVLANDFEPDRAHGTERAYSATFVLDRARDGQFTHVQVRYVDRTPYGSVVEDYDLGPAPTPTPP